MRRYTEPILVVVGAGVILFLLYVALPGPRSWTEPNAPELGRTYLLVQDAVLTSNGLVLPGPLRQEHTVQMIMPLGYFNSLNDFAGNLLPPLPDEGKVGKGARVRIDQMLQYSDPSGTIRYGRGQLTDLDGNDFTVYMVWDKSADIDTLMVRTK